MTQSLHDQPPMQEIHSVTIKVHENNTMLNSEYFTTHTWKQNHRMIIDVWT
jgi:hypothetical protein